MRVNDAKEIAEIIRETAKQKNVSILQMCVDCGVSKNALSSMNAGSMPSISTVAKFADYLGVSIDRLLGNEGRAKSPLDEQLKGELFAASGLDEEITEEQKEAILNFIKWTKTQKGNK